LTTKGEARVSRYLTERDQENIRGVTTMLYLARTPAMRGREAAYYRAAGEHLARLQQNHRAAEWISIVREYCHLGPRRAYELVAIARGLAVRELRARTSARTQKSREIKAKGPPAAPSTPPCGVATRTEKSNEIKAVKV
jgi:hypothetical protein